MRSGHLPNACHAPEPRRADLLAATLEALAAPLLGARLSANLAARAAACARR